MKKAFPNLVLIALCLLATTTSRNEEIPGKFSGIRNARSPARYYLGFDRNQFPGEQTLAALRKTFSFAGYWLNRPPGETTNTWLGTRRLLREKGFGFLVLFIGRSYKDLVAPSDPNVLGKQDAHNAVEVARREGFPLGAVIFLDLEEGGRLLPEQRAYIHAWIDGVNGSRFRAGIYCSGIPATEASGDIVITAQDIRAHAGKRQVVFWVYNDACPPSPGCAFPKHAPAPSKSGVAFAAVWQFAQSPQRKSVTASCPNTYSPHGNCYAPAAAGLPSVNIDVDTATSPDPSHGRGSSRRARTENQRLRATIMKTHYRLRYKSGSCWRRCSTLGRSLNTM